VLGHRPLGSPTVRSRADGMRATLLTIHARALIVDRNGEEDEAAT
jgi:hypothetical protein